MVSTIKMILHFVVPSFVPYSLYSETKTTNFTLTYNRELKHALF